MSSPAVAPSQIAQWLKGNSSKWIHIEFAGLQKFAWQDGYGVLSVIRSNVSKVVEYIKNQRQHHLKQYFEDEYIELLKLHKIDYDEKYLFG